MIVDDHEIVRRGIAEIIDRADGLDVVAEAGSRAEAVRRAELVRPDVILVDLQLPDGTGIELMQELRDSVPQALPIVLTSFDDDEALAEALAAGARAYLLKTVHGAEISDVVRAVASGRVLLDERTVTRRRADHDDPTADLTNAERKVLDLIGDGLSNREIGERLGVAEKTVKNHITSLLAKMGLQRGTQVAARVAGQRASGWRNSGRVLLRAEPATEGRTRTQRSRPPPSRGTRQVKQVPRRSPSERARGPMTKLPPWRRARSAMLAVPERRVTEGFTPTPSSRQTISTTGLPRKGSASPEA